MKPSYEFETLLRADEVQEIIPYTRQHIHRLEKAGQFPRRIHLGPNRVVWRLSELTAWLDARQQASNAI